MPEIKKNYNGAFEKEKETKLINPESFVTIQGWMITHLKLKGTPLFIYAIIYGFCQTQGQFFTGSVRYLAEWTNSTKRTVYQNLKDLVDKGLIIKIEENINGVKFCKYTICEDYLPSRMSQISPVMKKFHQGGEKISGGGEKISGGDEKISPNNIDNNIDDNIDIKKENLIKEKRRKSNIDDLISAIENYTENEELKEKLIKHLETRKIKKAAMTLSAIEESLKKLDKYSNNDEEKILMVQNAIISGWTGFYPISYTEKKQTNKKSGKLFDKPSYDLGAYEKLDGITAFGKLKNKSVSLDEMLRIDKEERKKEYIEVEAKEYD